MTTSPNRLFRIFHRYELEGNPAAGAYGGWFAVWIGCQDGAAPAACLAFETEAAAEEYARVAEQRIEARTTPTG
jgi:hypothetical protein